MTFASETVTLREALEQQQKVWRDVYERSGLGVNNPLWPYRMEAFVLRHAGLEKRGQATGMDGCPIQRMTAKECFSNAGRLAIHEGYEYREGYAVRLDLGIPIHHAWVEWDGHVLDPTWNDPENCLYLGVPFDTDFLEKWALKKGYWGLLDSGWGINVDVMKDYERITGKEHWKEATHETAE